MILLLLFPSVQSFEEKYIQNQKKKNSNLSTDIPGELCSLVHSLGKLVVDVETAGEFGGLERLSVQDCFSGEVLPYRRSEYPKGSGVGMSFPISTYFSGIKKSDTLVTQSHYEELKADNYFIRSQIQTSGLFSEDAVSELDINITGSDTSSEHIDYPFYWFDSRAHKPLGIETSRTSYSWSYDYSDDFVLFDLTVKNLNDEMIKGFYFTLTTYDGTGYSELLDVDGRGDIVGMLQDYTYENKCGITDKLNMMWLADGDGDPVNGQFLKKLTVVDEELFRSAPDISGVFLLSDFSNYGGGKKTTYNWWASSGFDDGMFMPIARATKKQSYPHNYAHPYGDNTYYTIISNDEIDYDQIYTASITKFDPIWNYPDQIVAKDISDGYGNNGTRYNHTHHMLSVGPFDIPPGAILKLPFAYVAGEDFHTLPSNGDNLPDNPDAYYSNLDFSDIANNAQWAKWIYDNPGVDTDGDGDSGRYTICVLDSQLVNDVWVTTAADTFWYQGDGVPDWKAAGPPPPPYVWLKPTLNGIKVRFNGTRSETEKDLFTQIVDFEGYNIYMGRDDRESSLSLVASIDHDNYDKFVYDIKTNLYIVDDVPLTLEEIRCAFADSCYDTSFDPLTHDRVNPISNGDTLIYFRKHSYNVNDGSISKVYPNARDPRLVDIDSLTEDDYTEEGYYKFFEYEFQINNLLPTVSYWINVTAFDFGSPKSGLPALESSKTLDIQPAYPLLSADEINTDDSKQVFIYPNPYRINAGYRDMGYEGRTEDDRPDYRVRELNFANLPPKCEIKIFSLDGDLIRHLSHDVPANDPTSSHHQWDLITRNTQMVVSGLYYWTVEFPNGEVQIGKFVVIM